jgi:hypothetical protein
MGWYIPEALDDFQKHEQMEAMERRAGDSARKRQILCGWGVEIIEFQRRWRPGKLGIGRPINTCHGVSQKSEDAALLYTDATVRMYGVYPAGLDHGHWPADAADTPSYQHR